MAATDVALVSTLSVFRSWLSFGATTRLQKFATHEGQARVHEQQERAEESVRLAHAAGVKIATGTDLEGAQLERTNWRGRSNASWPPDWNRGRHSPLRHGAEESC